MEIETIKYILIDLQKLFIINNIHITVDADCLVSTSHISIGGIMCNFVVITKDYIKCVVQDKELIYKDGIWSYP